MPDIRTSEESFADLAALLRREAENTGRYQVKVRILAWIKRNRLALSAELTESLLKEIS